MRVRDTGERVEVVKTKEQWILDLKSRPAKWQEPETRIFESDIPAIQADAKKDMVPVEKVKPLVDALKLITNIDHTLGIGNGLAMKQIAHKALQTAKELGLI